MNKSKVKALGILFLVVLFHYSALYVTDIPFIRQRLTAYDEIVWTLLDLFLYGSLIFLALKAIRKYAPDILRNEHSKGTSLFGFSGPRKYIILVCSFVIFQIAASRVDTLQSKLMGVGFKEAVEPIDVEVKENRIVQDMNLNDHQALKFIEVKRTANTVIAASVEELIYRFFILRVLMGLMPFWAAGFLSSLLFGLAHIPARLGEGLSYAIYKVLPTMINGFFYALAASKFGVKYSIVFHSAHNLMMYADDETSEIITQWNVILVFLVLPLLLVQFGLQVLVKKLISLHRNRRAKQLSVAAEEGLHHVVHKQSYS